MLDVGEGRAKGGLVEEPCGGSDGSLGHGNCGVSCARWCVAGGGVDDVDGKRGRSGGDGSGGGQFGGGDVGGGHGGAGDLDLGSIEEAGTDHVNRVGGRSAALRGCGSVDGGDGIEDGLGQGSGEETAELTAAMVTVLGRADWKERCKAQKSGSSLWWRSRQ